MAVSFRVVGTWAELIADGSVAIPATPQAGDRMYLFARWKDFAITAQITSPSGWTKLSEFTDGAVSSGNGTGSVKVACWYRNWQTGDTDPTIDFSASPTNASAVIIVMAKAAADAWLTPTAVTAAMTSWTTSSQSVSASSTVNVLGGGVVMGLIGIRDDSATMTRPTSGIDDSAAAVTWNGDYVEAPATHHSTTTGDDGAADLGYRLVTAGATATLRMTGTISAAETGAALWVVQGVEVNLTIQDASHAHIANNVALTQTHGLTVANASHVQTATSVALTQVHALTIQNSSHSQTAISTALTQVHILNTQSAAHTHSAATVAITQTHVLEAQSPVHNHTAGSLTLEVIHNLSVQDSNHAHTATSITLTQVHELVVEDAVHEHTAQSPNVRSVLLIFVDPGGDAVQVPGYFNIAGGAGSVEFDTTEKVVGVGSWKFDSGAGGQAAYASVAGVMGASRRVGLYFRYDSVPDTTQVISGFMTWSATYSGSGFSNFGAFSEDDGDYAAGSPPKNAGVGNVLVPASPLDIPLGAVIDSVKIIYERKYDVDTSIGVSRVKWRVDDEEGPNHDNTDMPLTDTVVEVDVTGDRGWEQQYFLGGRFEVIAEARRGDTDVEHTQSWDYVKVEVQYHATVQIVAVLDGAGDKLFGLSLLSKGSNAVLRFADTAGTAFDGITLLPLNQWTRISFACNLPAADNLSAIVFIEGIQELSVTEMSTGGSPSPSALRYGWTGQPGIDRICWFDQVYIDDGEDLSDPGDRRSTAKLATTVNEDEFDTTGGSGAVNERPPSETNYRQQAASSRARQNYNIQAADDGDVDISSETVVGIMGWLRARRSLTIGAGTPSFTLDGTDYGIIVPGSSPVTMFKGLMQSTYPSSSAAIGLVSGATSVDYFLYECGVIPVYEGPDISPRRILAYQELPEGTILDLVDDLRADPPDSYEFCYRSSESETAYALITVTSLDHDGGNIYQQMGEFVLNNSNPGRARISAGVEVQIHVEIIGGPVSVELYHRLNVD